MDRDQYIHLRIFSLNVLSVLLTAAVLLAGTEEDKTADRINRHTRALGWALGYDVGIWVVNRYIRDQDWAVISMESLGANIEHGWVMDEDEFDVNQFGHPYQGSLVFSAARAQGLNFWEAVPYPVLSSFIWEIGMENEYPSVNDMITTPLSGITFGEITHRLSLLACSENGSTGEKLLAGALNPARIPELIRMSSAGRSDTKSVKWQAGTAAGIGLTSSEPYSPASPDNAFIRFYLNYGDPFDKDIRFRNFDTFNIMTVLNFREKEAVAEIYTSGLLISLAQVGTENTEWLAGIFKNYDYFNQDDFKVSSSEIGLGLVTDLDMFSDIHIRSEFHPSWIIMGSSGDTSDEDPDLRDYFYGSGHSEKGRLLLNYRDRLTTYINVHRYTINNIEGEGDNLRERTVLVRYGLQWNFTVHSGLGIEYTSVRHESDHALSLNESLSASVSRIYIVYRL